MLESFAMELLLANKMTGPVGAGTTPCAPPDPPRTHPGPPQSPLGSRRRKRPAKFVVGAPGRLDWRTCQLLGTGGGRLNRLHMVARCVGFQRLGHWLAGLDPGAWWLVDS
jgi:hypothetical protein